MAYKKGEINKDFYSAIDINQRLKNKGYGARLISTPNEGVYLTIKGKKRDLNIPYEKRGAVPKEKLETIAEEVSKNSEEERDNILENLTTQDFDAEKFKRVTTKLGMLVLIFGFVFFALDGINPITGSAVSNISNTTSNIGIFICSLLVIGMIIYHWRQHFSYK